MLVTIELGIQRHARRRGRRVATSQSVNRSDN